MWLDVPSTLSPRHNQSNPVIILHSITSLHWCYTSLHWCYTSAAAMASKPNHTTKLPSNLQPGHMQPPRRLVPALLCCAVHSCSRDGISEACVQHWPWLTPRPARQSTAATSDTYCVPQVDSTACHSASKHTPCNLPAGQTGTQPLRLPDTVHSHTTPYDMRPCPTAATQPNPPRACAAALAPTHVCRLLQRVRCTNTLPAACQATHPLLRQLPGPLTRCLLHH